MGCHLDKVKSAPLTKPLPTIRVGEVKAPDASAGKWLVETLWSHRAVGVLGGPPKSTKICIAVDLALSVASGTKALDAYT